MTKYINKTQATKISAISFLKENAHPDLVADCLGLMKFFAKVTGHKPVIWGNIVGFGKYHYISKACEADWFITGFAPRASTIAIYVSGQVESKEALLKKLGAHKMSGTCIHIKKLKDIDLKVLEQIVLSGIKYMNEKYQIKKV